MCNMFNMCYNSIFRGDIPCNMSVTCVVTHVLTIFNYVTYMLHHVTLH